MINPQITDSVTQIIKYKEGMGKGSISKIVHRYYDDSKYDDIINKFNNPNDLHLPNIDEFKILHSYLGGLIIPNNYMTTETLEKDSVTLCYVQKGIFVQGKRSDAHPVILVQIEYNNG